MNWLKTFWKAVAEQIQRNKDKMEVSANFTPRAQQVLSLARLEATRLNHKIIGTDDVLLGLLKLGQGVAVTVLEKCGVDLETVREEVEKITRKDEEDESTGNLLYTQRVKKVLGLASKEAKALNHTYVGTEHILLGLLREGEGAGAAVLRNLGVKADEVRTEILKELDPNFQAEPSNEARISAPPKPATPLTSDQSATKLEPIDMTKRYDVYCTERNQDVVVYRNVLFKGVKVLLDTQLNERVAKFIELEQADGTTIFGARVCVIKFCEHGITPNSEIS